MDLVATMLKGELPKFMTQHVTALRCGMASYPKQTPAPGENAGVAEHRSGFRRVLPDGRVGVRLHGGLLGGRTEGSFPQRAHEAHLHNLCQPVTLIAMKKPRRSHRISPSFSADEFKTVVTAATGDRRTPADFAYYVVLEAARGVLRKLAQKDKAA